MINNCKCLSKNQTKIDLIRIKITQDLNYIRNGYNITVKIQYTYINSILYLYRISKSEIIDLIY